MAAHPQIGDPVIFRPAVLDSDVPAIVTATLATLDPSDVARGYVPSLASDQHVHLVVFTPIKAARRGRGGGSGFEIEAEHGYTESTSGVYQRWNVPPNPHGQSPPLPNSWR